MIHNCCLTLILIFLIIIMIYKIVVFLLECDKKAYLDKFDHKVGSVGYTGGYNPPPVRINSNVWFPENPSDNSPHSVYYSKYHQGLPMSYQQGN